METEWRPELSEQLKHLSDFQLAEMDLRDLQSIMEDVGLVPEQVKQMKLIRKRMKNRISARAHSQKQHSEIQKADQVSRPRAVRAG